jgi:predicted transcriptional regulator
MRKLGLLFCLACMLLPRLQAQEIKANVQVIAPSLQLTNKQILTTLQNAIQQFINTRKWTDDAFEAREKIEISLFFEVKKITNASDFIATLQIQSTRPVYGSNYKTTVFSFNDEDVAFAYREFEPLDYQDNQNVNDLTSLLAFYVYMALGYDYDSFAELGGSLFYQKAQNIGGLMQGKPGWNQGDGKGQRNRFNLIDGVNNNRFVAARKLTYLYHRKGLDKMAENTDQARAEITSSIKSLEELFTLSPNNLITRVFFSTKWAEIVEIYKPAPVTEKNSILDLLRKLDSQNSNRYEKIKS